MMRTKSQGEEEDQEDGKPNSHMEVSGGEWRDKTECRITIKYDGDGIYQIINCPRPPTIEHLGRECPTPSGKLVVTVLILQLRADRNFSSSTCWSFH